MVGPDPVTSAVSRGPPSGTTQVVGSVDDRELVRATISDFAIDAIVHAGARHKPNTETHRPSDFVAVNVQGTLNLLEEAVAYVATRVGSWCQRGARRSRTTARHPQPRTAFIAFSLI